MTNNLTPIRRTTIKKTKDNTFWQKEERATYTVGRKLFEKQYGISLKLKIELPSDPVVPLLDIWSKEVKFVSQGDICTPKFITALFTIAKIMERA